MSRTLASICALVIATVLVGQGDCLDSFKQSYAAIVEDMDLSTTDHIYQAFDIVTTSDGQEERMHYEMYADADYSILKTDSYEMYQSAELAVAIYHADKQVHFHSSVPFAENRAMLEGMAMQSVEYFSSMSLLSCEQRSDVITVTFAPGEMQESLPGIKELGYEIDIEKGRLMEASITYDKALSDVESITYEFKDTSDADMSFEFDIKERLLTPSGTLSAEFSDYQLIKL